MGELEIERSWVGHFGLRQLENESIILHSKDKIFKHFLYKKKHVKIVCNGNSLPGGLKEFNMPMAYSFLRLGLLKICFHLPSKMSVWKQSSKCNELS